MEIREATVADEAALTRLRAALWPDATQATHRAEVRAILARRLPSPFPLAIFVAVRQRELVGFVEVGLRSHADGCDPARCCGFVEGWYVTPVCQRQGVGRALIARAEAWARAQGCTELASDTWADHEISVRAHLGVGFSIVDRAVNFRKSLEPTLPPSPPAPPFYGPDLARLHHEYFGDVARSAARELLGRLSTAGLSSGTVVDLAAGSGILCRRLGDAGYQAWGVDLSADMLDLARAEAPAATLARASLWSVELPRCVAVVAVGEAFSYATDPTAGERALGARLGDIRRALVPGGILLFDVAGPNRSGPGGSRRAFYAYERGAIGVEEERSTDARRLTRRVTAFLRQGAVYRRVDETHELCLYDPDRLEALLTETGFTWERLEHYDRDRPRPGWHVYAASARS